MAVIDPSGSVTTALSIPPPGTHAQIAAEVLRRAERMPSAPSHNRGGWRSDDDFLLWGGPAVHLIAYAVETLVRQRDPELRLARGWAIVNRDGSHHGRHIHRAPLSAIYYVTGGGARTYFEIPGQETGEPFYVEPEAGLVVVFPGPVFHGTEMSTGPTPRITIAFDAEPR